MRGTIIEIAMLCLLLQPSSADASGGDDTPRKIVPVAEVGVNPSYTLPTNRFFRGTETEGRPVGTALSTHLKYGFRFGSETFYGKLYPHVIQGIGIGYDTFFNPSTIGNPVSLYVFQTSRIASLTERLSLDYEWNFGVSFGWKKYDQTPNPPNTIVGSKVNACIRFGLLLNWRLGSHLKLKAGIGMAHFSNGNTSYPNAGINTAGGSMGLAWDFDPENVGKDEKREIRFKPYVSYDLAFYGSVRKKGFRRDDDGTPVIVPGTFAVAGMNLSPMYNFSKYFRAGISLDAQFDESANIADHIVNTDLPVDDIKFHRPPFGEQFSLGVSARAEVVMPIFSINIGGGRNILCKGPDTDSFYQIFALKTNITPQIFIHTGYQLYRFKDPNNLMLGIGYRFR